MNRAVHEASEGAPTDVSVYDTELKAACHNLQAEKSDLEHLVGPIVEKQVPPPQVSWLLKQMWLRLKALRESQTDFAALIDVDPESYHLVTKAFSRLHTGKDFFLDDAKAIFEQLYKHCQETNSAPELSAKVRASQALIAAIKLDFRSAAELYAQAAQTPGLEVTQQWQYQVQRGQVLEDLGRDFMDDAALTEAIELYETDGLDLAPKPEKPDDWAVTQYYLGNALSALGQRQRGTRLLERAIQAFENALSVRRRSVSLEWAAIQHSLGNALGNLAQRHADTGMLEQAVEAFESAMQARTLEQTPQDWAMTQNSYATALLALGQRKKDSKILKRASEAYKNVLQVWTRERGPME